MTRRYLTAHQAAEYLGTTVTALRKRVERGDIPHIKDGRRVRFDVQDLDLYMRVRRVKEVAS